ncbi:cytoplasmic chaperone TorD family protein [Halorhabdus sp. CBA1104]|uniref:TorD/DmsD family molecular chaperone n=1 Tax=Halorhabdus sp. CBA1104 TaxID=1380432 RepID=UPI0012B42A91|nr:molecular chaperone TorD family protein [Halorhabdus sp. CBA1104]QGN08010.1 cytoplasmic chaperone TorD family protein [Halorhabdus sp. CBA1104]
MSDATAGGEATAAQGYAVLARCWRQPDEQLRTAIESGALAGVVSERETLDLTALRTEHARLFVGPDSPPCPPYESIYRDGDGDTAGNVLGPSTRAVVDWYDEYGLGLDPEWSDLPDHIATELEFAGHLSAVASRETCEQFLDEHPRQWFETFLDGVRAETREPFYAELADATAAVVR